jgi:hypothetical protein
MLLCCIIIATWKDDMKKIIVWAVTAAVLVSGGIFFLSKYDEWFKYPALRDSVNSRMKDPASTQYRNERLTPGGWLCGELNSKNGNGGYVGFKRFVTKSASDAYMEDYGYIGTDRKESTTQIIEQLNLQTTILEKNSDAREVNPEVSPLSKSEINQMVAQQYFEKMWKISCMPQ